MVKTMDEEWMSLGFLGSKMVPTADIFIYFEETKTQCFQLSSKSMLWLSNSLKRVGSL